MKLSILKLSLMAAAMATGSIGHALAAEIEGGATTMAAPMSSNLGPVSQAMLDASEGDKNNWLHSNMAYTNSRYYPADQINAGNVKNLKPAFISNGGNGVERRPRRS
jgi:glucose dehydrogenase